MSLQDILNKRYGGESSGRDVSSSFQSKIAERYNPLVNYRKQQKENERIRKQQETQRKQQEAIQQFQQKQEETQRRSERGGLINFAKNAYQGIKQAVGRGETLPEIQGGSNLYQAYRQSQLAEQDYKKRIFARGSQAVLDFGKKKADTIRESEEERGKLGTVVEAGKGAVKNLGELASGLGKIGLEFSPLTGMSGIRKVVSFVGGQRVEEYLDRNTPEYQKKVDAFVDENNILNYKAQYNNEIQKTGGEVAEIGSWFIPITRSGTVAKLEKTIADIPKVSKLLNATPKVVKVGENLAYEVSKDVVDIAILDAVRGKTWEEIQEDAKLGGIGSFGLRGVGGAIGDAIKLGKSKKFVGQIEKSLGKLDDVETKIVKDLSAEGKTLDDIATDIMAKREKAGVDIYKDLDVSKSFDDVSKTPSTSTKPPKRSVETIKPETPVKPQSVSEGISKAKAEGKSFDEFAEPRLVYHGSNEGINKFDDSGAFFTDDLNNADGYAGGENVYEGFLDLKNPLVIDAKGRHHADLKTPYGTSTQEIVGKVDDKKYDGVIFKNINDSFADDVDIVGSDTIFYPFNANKSFINESQLKQLWDKGAKEVKPKVKAPKQPKESITAKKMNQRLNGVDELSTKYDVVNLNKEINEASSLIEKNKTKAVETVFSDTGSNTQKVAIATELFEKAVVEGDVKTQSLLFNRIKKLSTETAQALNMFKALTVTNPHFKYMKEVVNLRLDKIKIRGEDITRAMNKKTEPIVASITKATKSRVKIVNAQKLLDKLIC